MDQKQVKEKYYLPEEDSKTLHYEVYYESGTLKTRGYYSDRMPTGNWKYFDEEGRLKMRGKFDGTSEHGYWEYYSEEGDLTMEGNIHDGKREGRWKFYWDNGRVKSEGYFKDGEKVDIWQEYTNEGILKAESEYLDDRIRYTEYYPNGNKKIVGANVDGKPDGLWSYYYEDGTLQSRGNYNKGRKEGIWEYFYPNGQLSAHGNFVDDFPDGEWIHYYRNGQISSTGELREGNKHGSWKLYFNQGTLKGEGSYFNGTGEYKEYYPSGHLRLFGTIVDGERHGKWNYLGEDGQIEGEAIYKRGKGKYTGYHSNGNVKVRGNLVDDKKVGRWEIYNKKGELEGYYKPYSDMTLSNVFIAGKLKLSRSGSEEKPRKIADYVYKKRPSSPFKPQLNEFRSLIFEFNPVSTLFGNFPVGIEHYNEERLGHQLMGGLLREPFYKSAESVGINTIYTRGYYFSLRQKFYFAEGTLGMTYLAHEIRYSRINHNARILINDTMTVTNETSKCEDKFEYSVLIGKRLLKESSSSGISLDAFIGIGTGYRIYNSTYEPDEQIEEVYSELPDSNVPVAFRVGINIGYSVEINKR